MYIFIYLFIYACCVVRARGAPVHTDREKDNLSAKILQGYRSQRIPLGEIESGGIQATTQMLLPACGRAQGRRACIASNAVEGAIVACCVCLGYVYNMLPMRFSVFQARVRQDGLSRILSHHLLSCLSPLLLFLLPFSLRLCCALFIPMRVRESKGEKQATKKSVARFTLPPPNKKNRIFSFWIPAH